MGEETTARRKDAHLDLCATGDVEPAGNRTLLECVHLVHCALPELAVDEVDLSHAALRQDARARPLLVTGMTGGTERAGAGEPRPRAAWRSGTGWPSGWAASGRWPSTPSAPRPSRCATWRPTVALLGNIGLRQAVAHGRGRGAAADGRHRRGRAWRCTSTPARS